MPGVSSAGAAAEDARAGLDEAILVCGMMVSEVLMDVVDCGGGREESVPSDFFIAASAFSAGGW